MCQEICEYDTIYESRLEMSKYRSKLLSFKYPFRSIYGENRKLSYGMERCSNEQYMLLPRGLQWPENL